MARTLKAVVLTLDKLHQFYKPFMVKNEGNKFLGLVTPSCPFALQGMFLSAQQLRSSPTSLVYLCTHKENEAKQTIVKIIAGDSYPISLHEELAALGHAPTLHYHQRLSGGFMLLCYEFLGDGWVSLNNFDCKEALPLLQAACEKALSALHSCLGGRAVHGDMRPPNIFVCCKRDIELVVKVNFIDFDWGGFEGKATYPPFIYGEAASRGIVGNLVGAVITQDHDRFLLSNSISKCLVMTSKRPTTEIETVDDLEYKKLKL